MKYWFPAFLLLLTGCDQIVYPVSTPSDLQAQGFFPVEMRGVYFLDDVKGGDPRKIPHGDPKCEKNRKVFQIDSNRVIIYDYRMEYLKPGDTAIVKIEDTLIHIREKNQVVSYPYKMCGDAYMVIVRTNPFPLYLSDTVVFKKAGDLGFLSLRAHHAMQNSWIAFILKIKSPYIHLYVAGKKDEALLTRMRKFTPVTVQKGKYNSSDWKINPSLGTFKKMIAGGVYTGEIIFRKTP